MNQNYVFYKIEIFSLIKEACTLIVTKLEKTVDHMATKCEKMLIYDYMRRHNAIVKCIL